MSSHVYEGAKSDGCVLVSEIDIKDVALQLEYEGYPLAAFNKYKLREDIDAIFIKAFKHLCDYVTTKT